MINNVQIVYQILDDFLLSKSVLHFPSCSLNHVWRYLYQIGLLSLSSLRSLPFCFVRTLIFRLLSNDTLQVGRLKIVEYQIYLELPFAGESRTRSTLFFRALSLAW